MSEQAGPRRTAMALLLILAALALGLFTTMEHVNELGVEYLDAGPQLQRHRSVLEGRAGNPWQYRVLSTWLVEGTVRFCAAQNLPPSVAFIWFRVLQDAAIFLLAFLYYRELGLSRNQALIGMSLLAWGMSYTTFDSDLQFNTYMDVIFYLLAALLILRNALYLVIPLMILAALNRETSGLIPFMFLFTFAIGKERGERNKIIAVVAIALVVYAAVFFGLRAAYGPQQLFIPYGHHQGLDLFQFNIARPLAWYRLWATMGMLPILALMGYRYWPPRLRVFFWVIVPVWFAVHLFAAVMAETRLFLVPQAVIFVPGALFLACGCMQRATDERKSATDEHR